MRHAHGAPLEAGGSHELALAPVSIAVRAANGEQLVVGVSGYNFDVMTLV